MKEEFKYTEPKAVELTWWQRVFQFALPLVVIALAVLIAKKIIDGRVQPKRKQKQEMIARADVVTVKQADSPVELSIMGTVIPAEMLSLKPRVSGEVIQVNPELENGKQLKKGEWAVKIDSTDYELAFRKAELQKEKVEAELLVEKGRQALARQEFELFDKKDGVSELDKSLALREPQLKLAQSNLELAENEIALRKLDLERCVVQLPFDSLVSEKIAAPGMQLSTQQTIAELIRSDYFYIEASISVSDLVWLDLENPVKNQVTVYYNDGKSSRKARLLRVLSRLETQGRMARLLMVVDTPLDKSVAEGEQLPLLLDTYVRVVLTGRTIASSYKLPREALRDGNSVWVAAPAEPGSENAKDNGHELHIRSVKTKWRNRKNIFIGDGLSSGEMVVVSNLPAAVEGMKVKLASIDGIPVRNGKSGDKPSDAKADPEESE